MTEVKIVQCFDDICDLNLLKSWCDVDDKKNALSSLEKNSSVWISKAENQKDINRNLYLPPELMEKIVCYFDGRTLLKFKLLSNTCDEIACNAVRYNKLWKKICLKEIPKKYLITLCNKRFDTFIPLDSLSEIEYEELYKQWLHWQSSVFNVTLIGEHHFLDYATINKIICYKHDVMVIFSNFTLVFSLVKNKKTKSLKIKKNELKLIQPNMVVIRNPRSQSCGENKKQNLYITCYQKHFNSCPLHDTFELHDGNSDERQPTGKLLDVDTNMYMNICCWVRESWYEWHLQDISNVVNGHYCHTLKDTIYTCVVHGVIVSLSSGNCIIVHGIYKGSCTTIRSWLDRKYTRATALHIYTNILFVGTQNSYLLAYRLQCWDDLINPKKENLLLETKLQMGQIEKIDIIDYESVKTIIVASLHSIYWLKVN